MARRNRAQRLLKQGFGFLARPIPPPAIEVDRLAVGAVVLERHATADDEVHSGGLAA
jgi:hypothetical protein